MGLNRPVYHLMIGLYGPEGTQDLVRSFTVIGQSAEHVRNALAGINPGMRIAGEIATPLSQAFQRVDEIAVNEPTPPPANPPDDLISKGAVDQLLADLADGKVHVVRNETGTPVIEEGPAPHGTPDHAAEGTRPNPTGGMSASQGDMPSNSKSGGDSQTDPASTRPDILSGAQAEFTNDPRDSDGKPIVPEGGPEAPR